MKMIVKDSVEIRSGMPGTKHAPGMVLFFNSASAPSTLRKGSHLWLTRPGGQPVEVVIGEVKRHGSSRSVFIEGLSKVDAAIGSQLSLPAASTGKKRTIAETRR